MGLFLDETEPVSRPPVSSLAVASLIVSVTGFINLIGFLIGPVLAHIALARLRGTNVRGRRMAIATLWISYGVLALAIVTLITLLVAAWIALPQPVFF